MKKSIVKILSILLALMMMLGVMPVGAEAGGDPDPIQNARVFVHYPMGGQLPNMQGTVVGSKDFTIDFVHFFDCQNGMPVGKFLEDTLFTAGRLYACQVHLVPKTEEYAFTDASEVYINGHWPDAVTLDDDGSAYYTVFFRAALGTWTVTFDTGGRGTPHDPVQVPKGATLADAVADVSTLDPIQDYESFVMWALDPLDIPYSYNAVGYYDPITEDVTYYALWSVTVDTVDLYVQVPPNCFTQDVYKPTITVPANADYYVEPEYFYLGLVDGHLHNDLVYIQPFRKGDTYYSQAMIHTRLAGKLPKINLYGGTVVSVERWGDDRISVIYKLTVPGGSSLTSAAAYVETPQAGQSASGSKPKITGLTPGLDMKIAGWYQNSSCSGSYYTGTLAAGNTYYAMITIGGSGCAYSIAYNTLKLTLRGRGVKLVKMVNLATGSAPNTVGAVISVTIPRQYQLYGTVPHGGGMIRYAKENPFYETTLNYEVEEGPVTVEAMADANHLFKSWYNTETYEMLSKNAVYTFNLNKNTKISATFVVKPPFVDVGAWDYFYEPVMWALAHDPQITGGVDATHFGPNENCTRAQVMTFLWKALKEPWSSSYSCPFVDVKPGNYYYKPVVWAYRNNVTGGVDPTHFGPGENCTRAQVMTYLWASKGRPQPSGNYNPFKDVKPSDYYYKAVLWAVENGVTAGVGDGLFGSGETCTRAQVITFLCKVYGPKG